MAIHLYNLTLEKGGAVSCSCQGSFTEGKQQEVVVARGQWIELLKVDETGHVKSVDMQNVFGVVRCLAAFRLHGAPKDHLIVTSDSGRVVVLQYNLKKNGWEKVLQETYGKTGLRRAVPGQYLATDPGGRAFMIGAVEKQKFAYILDRDNEAKITISSPLEAHKSGNITYNMVGLDVGYDNPVFAAIEVDHAEADEDPSESTEKHLVFYELDLGLFHVIRKSPWSDSPLPDTANLMIPVPGGDVGPGGVLVCVDNYLMYMNLGHETLEEIIPRRQHMLPTAGLMIICGTVRKARSSFFIIVQSEYGDLYKVDFELTADKRAVTKLHIQYFDTVPPATSLTILKPGYLYVASEFSNHKLYQFNSLGEKDDGNLIGAMSIVDKEDGKKKVYPLFEPRERVNLTLIDEVNSLSPLIDIGVGDEQEDIEGKRLFALCGRGAQSSLRILQHGLSPNELAHSPLPAAPENLWTIKKEFNSPHDDYIVVSFVNATIVLSIGATIQEVTDSGFQGNCSTIVCRVMKDNSFVQITEGCIYHIVSGKTNAWKTPGTRNIERAAANEQQVVISLQGGEVIYFELDSYGQLNEVAKKGFGKEICCLALGPLSENRMRSGFLAIGFTDKDVQVVTLDPDNSLQMASRQTCNSEPADIKIVRVVSDTSDREEALCVYIGCSNGILLRSVIDRVTGVVKDTRTKFCGTRPCKLVTTKAAGQEAVMVLSSRTWLAYHYQGKQQLNPLSCPAITRAAPFSSEDCPEGAVAVTGSKLSIYSMERLGECFNQSTIPLKATPRAFIKHPHYPYYVILETDHRAYTDEEKEGIRKNMRESLAEEGEEVQEGKALPEKDYGTIKASQGKWVSYLRLWDAASRKTLDLVELDENQAAFAGTTCVFHDMQGEVMLVVGTAKDFIPNPRCLTSGLLLTFKFINRGTALDMVHKTTVDGLPKALHPFQGRLLVGLNEKVLVYDFGRTRLLRKCENKQVPNLVVKITSHGDRIFVGDVTNSVYCLKYKKIQNHMSVFAEDTVPRWTTALVALDHSTIAIGDKLGNITIARFEDNISDEIENDPNCTNGSSKWLWDRGFLNGSPQRLQVIASYFVGCGITSLQKTALTAGGVEVILYTTINGGIGCCVPITNRRDSELLKLVEMHLRQAQPPLCGRDHLAFRSYYSPQKGCTDGDFAEQYDALPLAEQIQIAEELNRRPAEISKRLEEIRNKVL